MASTIAANRASGKSLFEDESRRSDTRLRPERQDRSPSVHCQFPIEPPGKNKGCTTYESVAMASRAGQISSAASPRCSSADCERRAETGAPPARCPACRRRRAHHNGRVSRQRQRAAPIREIRCGVFNFSPIQIPMISVYYSSEIRQPLVDSWFMYLPNLAGAQAGHIFTLTPTALATFPNHKFI